jgi:hypothetical protein
MHRQDVPRMFETRKRLVIIHSSSFTACHPERSKGPLRLLNPPYSAEDHPAVHAEIILQSSAVLPVPQGVASSKWSESTA